MDYREISEIRDGMRIDWDMPITMDDGVDPKVRIGMAVLAVFQLAIGLWAVLDPSGWFHDFFAFGWRVLPRGQ